MQGELLWARNIKLRFVVSFQKYHTILMAGDRQDGLSSDDSQSTHAMGYTFSCPDPSYSSRVAYSASSRAVGCLRMQETITK